MTFRDEQRPSLSALMRGIIIFLVVAILIAAAWLIGAMIKRGEAESPSIVNLQPPRQQTATLAPSLTASPTVTVTPSPTRTPTPTFTPSPTLTPSPTNTPTPTPLPPLYWEELGYLASVEYTASTVVEKERAKPGLGALLGTDHILLTAVGRIQMGVDLGQIDESDVEIDRASIKVLLPRAIVISVELLPDESHIYESDKSWLFSEYEGLEIEAMEQARQQLLDQAHNNQGMAELAETLARLQLTEFLRGVGYEEIEILFALVEE